MADWNETIQSMNKTDELLAEITRLRVREKELTLEGLALIGRLERIRDLLAGTDVNSLPKDYPLERMADDRMEELSALRALVAEAAAVIKPFAEEAVRYAPDEGDGDDILWDEKGWLRIKHVRAAAQWMEKSKTDG